MAEVISHENTYNKGGNFWNELDNTQFSIGNNVKTLQNYLIK